MNGYRVRSMVMLNVTRKRKMIGVDRRLFPTRSDFLTSSNSFMKIWDDIVENGTIPEKPNNPKNTTEKKIFMKICFVPGKINPVRDSMMNIMTKLDMIKFEVKPNCV
ncbi:hypothetical protein LIER_14969 [Lithospermum erythrorhizon]|uniref:Uncharacterized protein n=1 Tax=Lithospermum erythrorhizon TaxID=34254 RepID=A0AAV3Q2L5_LITER